VKCFVDTNVLLYAHDSGAGDKHTRSRELVAWLWRERCGFLSVQVVQEFYANHLRKLRAAAVADPIAQARATTALYLAWTIVEGSPGAVIEASEIQERCRLSFWDSLIVWAARQAQADVLLTEDLNHGQDILGVKVHNPFVGQALPSL
jgi:predicted nucleic acid-binding protein